MQIHNWLEKFQCNSTGSLDYFLLLGKNLFQCCTLLLQIIYLAVVLLPESFPREKCGANCKSTFPAWSGISPCKLRWVLLCFPLTMTSGSSLQEWICLLRIPHLWINPKSHNSIDCTVWQKWGSCMAHSDPFEGPPEWPQGIVNCIFFLLY